MHRIGFHVRNMKEYDLVTNLRGVNLIEIKPESFERKDNVQFWRFNGKDFIPNLNLISYVSGQCARKDIDIQIHMPFETKHDSYFEVGLCQADRLHHDLLLKKYDMIGNLNAWHGFGKTLTVHPPAFMFKGEKMCGVGEALDAGRELYWRLDQLKKQKGYEFKVGLENMTPPKNKGTSMLGFTPKHLDFLIGDTSGIGITMDSGHRNLSNEMHISTLFRYALIVNCHFHSNPGVFSEIDYDDDKHELATPDNLPNYGRYVKSFRRFNIPVVLEIGDLMKHNPRELEKCVSNLRREIELN